MEDTRHKATAEAREAFSELVRFTMAGFIGGLALGAILDYLGFSRSGIGQWLVRTVSGEGESLLEGGYAVRKRLTGATTSLAAAYGWGKLLGMGLPWIVDGLSRLAGVDVYGVPGFYIPFFYAMSDQIGGNVSGLLFLHRNAHNWAKTIRAYLSHPVMVSGLVIILAVPVGLATARMLGFRPTTQMLTAAETIVANLCWLPPLVGWLLERRSGRQQARR